jgi:hypothetical protein
LSATSSHAIVPTKFISCSHQPPCRFPKPASRHPPVHTHAPCIQLSKLSYKPHVYFEWQRLYVHAAEASPLVSGAFHVSHTATSSAVQWVTIVRCRSARSAYVLRLCTSSLWHEQRCMKPECICLLACLPARSCCFHSSHLSSWRNLGQQLHTTTRQHGLYQGQELAIPSMPGPLLASTQ